MALLVCGVFIVVSLYAPGIVLPQMDRAFRGTAHAALLMRLMGGIASFSFAVAAPIIGLVVARFGCRPVIFISFLLFAISATAPVFLDELPLIVAARALCGAATAGFLPAAWLGSARSPT